MASFTPSNLRAFEISATTAAAYLDACDTGAHDVRLTPERYQAYGKLLIRIFTLVDPDASFPSLLERSAAAREIAESLKIQRQLELSAINKPGSRRS